jgi:hypothetical protein
MLRSQLFAGDPLLEAIAADQDRISRSQHPTDPAVRKLQTGLLFWDPQSLPVNGADGVYCDETASAVVRFKVEVIGVPAESVIDDVGPQTVRRLDAMLPAAGPVPGVDPAVRDALRAILGDPTSPSVGALTAELARRGVTLSAGDVAAVMARLLAP